MSFAIRNLSVLSYAQGFTHWHYKATPLRLGEALVHGFFNPCGDMLNTGDVILISAQDGGGQLYVHSHGNRGVEVELMCATPKALRPHVTECTVAPTQQPSNITQNKELQMNSYTAGPWYCEPTLTGAISINKTKQVPIATIGGAGWHLGREMAQANARLIAAAPDLLEALERMMEGSVWEEARAFADGTPLPAGWVTKRMPSNDALDHARAALAAAKGEDRT